MKKSLTIILALCLALLMATPAFADYTIQDPNVTAPGELPVVKEPITLSLGIMSNGNITSYAYGENFETTHLEDISGVHLEFVFYPEVQNDAYSKLRLQISGGETLPELAVSIVGELIAVRNGKDGGLLREKKRKELFPEG